ncbi:MAG: hypothetical protein AB7K67_14060 [Hyphomicrobiaceae bacterium]|jgi:hypothetical protein
MSPGLKSPKWKVRFAAWFVGAGTALFLYALWAVSAAPVVATRWTLVTFGLAAAVFAGLAQIIVERPCAVERYASAHKPLAGPRSGAELPG